MTLYTVTITPDDPALATTTIRLDVTDATASIHELRLVPGASGGLLPGGLPVLDLNHLVAAVVAAVVPGSEPATAQPPSATAPQAAATAPQGAPGRGGARARTTEDTTAVTTQPRKKAAGKSTGAKPAKAAKPVKARKPAKKVTAAKPATKTAAAPTKPGSGRTYRRIPDDFDQVQRQAGQSASVIADHYGVPRHTAYSWIRSARKRDAATN
jgi:hypothetical protein